MKGVSIELVTRDPVAVCQTLPCGWRLDRAAWPSIPIGALAWNHVRDTGHCVDVITEDITRYSPDGAS